MSSAMDLDSSLDDIIKKRKNTSKNPKNKQSQQQQQQRSNRQNQNNNKRVGSGRRNNNNGGNNRGSASNSNNNNNNGRRNGRGNNNALSLSTKSKTINKSSRNNNPITRRVGQQQQKQQQQQQQQRQKNKNVTTPSTSTNTIDPTKIVITKKLSRNNNNKNKNNSNSNHSLTMNNGRMNPFPDNQAPTQIPISRGLSIRGASYGSSSMMYSNGINNGISIRGESGPAVVLIRNLDPGANAEDIRMICMQFGQVSNCEIAVDQMGRSFGEAEVEFAQKQAALDCISKLDNEVADGRRLQAILRDRSAGMINRYINQPVRSMIVPTRSGFTSA